MKTKNCRVRLKDIKQGRIIYVASPEFNSINVYLIKSKPFLVDLRYSFELFIKAHPIKDDGKLWDYYDASCISCQNSLRDMGVVSNTYNDRKTFFKRKHAEAYIKLHSVK